jgi:hypothetical protein
MHEANLKLNPEKCISGVTRGKVLGSLVSTKGIEASPLPQQNKSNHPNATSADKERSAEVNRLHSITQ